MKMEIKIRRANACDRARVSEIAKDAWRAIFEGFKAQLGDEIYDTVYAGDPLEKKAEAVRASLDSDMCFVAEYEGEVVGFATYVINGKVGMLSNNAVALRGHGIAGMLHERVFEEFKSHGCTVAGVTTGLDEAHAPARRAYEKDGFTNSIETVMYYKKI